MKSLILGLALMGALYGCNSGSSPSQPLTHSSETRVNTQASLSVTQNTDIAPVLSSPTPTAVPTIPSPTSTPFVVTLPSDIAALPEGQLVFDFGRGENDQSYILKPDRTVTQVTHQSEGAFYPVLSPDGMRIAFETGFLTSSIHLINIDGSGDTNLVEGASNPHWSLDGKHIIFGGSYGIERINIDGTNRETMMPIHEKIDIYGFSVSPDARWMAATTDVGSGIQGKITIFDLTTGHHMLFKNFAQDPAWSPDGTKVAFEMGDSTSPNFDIYIATSDGTGTVRLTTDPADDKYPTWSPDGKYIAFWSERDDPPEIYVMKADGSQQARVTDGGAGRLNWGPSPQP